MFEIFYNPNPFPGIVKGEHRLATAETYEEAVQAAIDNAELWGPTWVKKGRKIVFRSNAEFDCLDAIIRIGDDDDAH